MMEKFNQVIKINAKIITVKIIVGHLSLNKCLKMFNAVKQVIFSYLNVSVILHLINKITLMILLLNVMMMIIYKIQKLNLKIINLCWRIEKTRLDYWEFIKMVNGILFLKQIVNNFKLQLFKLYANK